jgi:WD40 repeat protein
MHIETNERISALRFYNDNELSAAGSKGTLFRYSTDGKQQAVVTIGRPGMGARFSDDGRWVVAAYGETKFEIFSTMDGRKIGETPQLTGGPRGTAFSPDGKTFVYATTDGMLHSWSLATGKMNWRIKAGLGEAWGIRFSPDQTHLFVTNADANVRAHSAANGELEAINDTLPISLFDCVYSPDGRLIAAAGAARQVHLFSAQGAKLERTFRREPDPIGQLSLSRDGKFLAAAMFQELSHRNPTRIVIYEFPTGKVAREIHTPSAAGGLSLAPASRMVAWSERGTGFEVDSF